MKNIHGILKPIAIITLYQLIWCLSAQEATLLPELNETKRNSSLLITYSFSNEKTFLTTISKNS